MVAPEKAFRYQDSLARLVRSSGLKHLQSIEAAYAFFTLWFRAIELVDGDTSPRRLSVPKDDVRLAFADSEPGKGPRVKVARGIERLIARGFVKPDGDLLVLTEEGIFGESFAEKVAFELGAFERRKQEANEREMQDLIARTKARYEVPDDEL